MELDRRAALLDLWTQNLFLSISKAFNVNFLKNFWILDDFSLIAVIN